MLRISQFCNSLLYSELILDIECFDIFTCRKMWGGRIAEAAFERKTASNRQGKGGNLEIGGNYAHAQFSGSLVLMLRDKR